MVSLGRASHLLSFSDSLGQKPQAIVRAEALNPKLFGRVLNPKLGSHVWICVQKSFCEDHTAALQAVPHLSFVGEVQLNLLNIGVGIIASTNNIPLWSLCCNYARITPPPPPKPYSHYSGPYYYSKPSTLHAITGYYGFYGVV